MAPSLKPDPKPLSLSLHRRRMEGLTRQFVPLLQAFLPGDLVSIVVSYDVVPTRLVVQVTSKDTGREDAWYLECDSHSDSDRDAMTWTKNWNTGLYSTPNLLREHKLECLVLDSMLYFDDGKHIVFPVSLRQPKLCEPDFVRSDLLVVQGLTTNALSQERLVTLCLDKKKRTALFQIQDETLDYCCKVAFAEGRLAMLAKDTEIARECYGLERFRLSIWTCLDSRRRQDVPMASNARSRL